MEQIDTYKIMISDNSYNVFNTTTFEKVTLPNFEPHHLFTNDVFSFHNDVITLIHSDTRTDTISGVLCLRNNKTYGRKNPNGRLLYKCIPDNKNIPAFLVPYEMKNVGFSKLFVNQYVTLKFQEWVDKHPHGIISNVIGPVDVIDNFYEYQLYCKSLHSSIQRFTKDTLFSLQDISHDNVIEQICEYHGDKIENRLDWEIFTIDPANTCDYDDAFSIIETDDGGYMLSVYIANVSVCIDKLQLWESFSRRISTIYLPNKKRPMLPTILSECLCSLVAGKKRIAFVMDIKLDSNIEMVSVKYSNCLIRVTKNFVYEEVSLLLNLNYSMLIDVVQKMSLKYKYLTNVRNSHEVVSYLMVLMNFESAKQMLEFKNGIFRTSVLTAPSGNNKTPSSASYLPEDVNKFIQIWKSASGQYVDMSKITSTETSFAHKLFDMEAYIHITSPIRRLVDLLNMIVFQKNMGMIQLSQSAFTFCDNWLSEMDYINSTMKSIRKVQNCCSLLDLCMHVPDTLNNAYDGYLFDKIVCSGIKYQYVVYLPELKLTYKFSCLEDVPYGEKRQFKIFIFSDEDSIKKKIRLQIIV